MTIQLPPELEERVRKRVAAGDASTVEDYVRMAVGEAVGLSESFPEKPRRTAAELIDEIWADAPEEAFASLPTDGSKQVDHYIYGTPKQDE